MSGDLPPSLERDALEVAGRRTHDRLAGRVRAGEGDLVDTRMRGERGTGGFAIAGHDVGHAGWDAGFHRQFAEPQRRQRRLFGWLEDDGAAGGERRTDFPNRGAERAVPRNDRANNADGLL
jgi:hypothetical protein